jgi:hypothetical protein
VSKTDKQYYTSQQMQASNYAKFLNAQAQPKDAKERSNSTMNYTSAKAAKPGAKPSLLTDTASQLKKHTASLSKDRSLTFLAHAA